MESISSQYYPQMLAQACESFGIDLDTPFEELPEEHQDIILNGTDDLSISIMKMILVAFAM